MTIFGGSRSQDTMSKGENRIIRRRLLNAYLSSVISISLVLLIVGFAGFLLVNTESVSDYFKEHIKLCVLIRPDVQEEEALAFCSEINELPFIREVEFISVEQGEQELTRMLGDDFLSVFETSPIPMSVEVSLKAGYVSSDSLAVVEDILAGYPVADEITYQESLVEKLDANLKRISIVCIGIIALLLFISIVLINNVMRLSVYDRRFIIHTMRLVGATKAFIRRPFMQRAAVLGLIASVIATVLLLGILYGTRSGMAWIYEIFRMNLLLVVVGIMILAGLLICSLSTYLVVNKLISLSNDELYY